MPQDEKPGRTYFYGLDLIRFAAALMVVLFHLSHSIYQSDSRGYVLTRGHHAGSGDSYFLWGQAGVEIFFVISGLVIANSASNSSAVRFLRGRAERLYPAIWICAPISFVIWWFGGVTSHAELVRTFAQSMILLPFGKWIDTPYWTLSHEVIFYGAVWLMLLAGRIGHLEKLAIGMTLVAAYNWIGQILALVFPIDLPGIGHLDTGAVRLFFPMFGAYFALGIFLWLHRNDRLSRAGLCISPFALAVALIPYLLSWHQDARFPQAGVAWIIGLIAIWLASARPSRLIPAEENRMGRAVRLFGLATYPLYLIHFALGAFLIATLTQWGLSSNLALAIVVPSLCLAALIIAGWMEPVLRRFIARAFGLAFRQMEQGRRIPVADRSLK